MERTINLAVLVRAYRINDAARLDQQLQYYAGLALEDAIHKAALALKPNGRRHSHQRWIPQSSLDAAAVALTAAKDALAACRTFEELLSVVSKNTQSIPRFRMLTCYDTALRVGARLNVLPELVYLHAGTAKGCSAIGMDTNFEALPMEKFPLDLRELKPLQVEDFLCIYKDELWRAQFDGASRLAKETP